VTDTGLTAFQDQRQRLFGIAYRMLGSATEAEDVLQDAFRYSHREVADTLSISGTSARQLVTRARKSLAARPRRAVDPAQWSEFVERFLRAARDGELQELEQLLSPQAMAVSDGGGIVSAGRFPIVGRQKITRFVAGLLAKYSDGLSGVIAEANGELVLIAQGAEGISAVWFIEFDDGMATNLRMVRNPRKLAFLAEQLSQNGELPGLS
jgi:hypothetical protein